MRRSKFECIRTVLLVLCLFPSPISISIVIIIIKHQHQYRHGSLLHHQRRQLRDVQLVIRVVVFKNPSDIIAPSSRLGHGKGAQGVNTYLDPKPIPIETGTVPKLNRFARYIFSFTDSMHTGLLDDDENHNRLHSQNSSLIRHFLLSHP